MTARRAIAAMTLALVMTACGAPKNGRPTLETRRTTTTADDSPTTVVVAGSGASTTSTTAAELHAVAPGAYDYELVGTNHATGTLKGVPFDQTKPTDKSWTVTYRKPVGRIQHLEATAGSEIVREDLSYRSGIAANVTSLRYSDAGAIRDFAPNPPARFVSIPLPVGATWQWSMTSAPSSNGIVVTRTGTFRAARTESVLVDGLSVKCVVIEGTITLDRPVAKTFHTTTWYAESLLLVVKEHELIDYRVNGDGTDLNFHIDQTSFLDSAEPN